MLVPPLIYTRPDGLVMATGCSVRPTDPREMRYALRATEPIDITVPYHLWDETWDYRAAIKNQGQMGACASYAATSCAETLAHLSAIDPPDLSAPWLYEKVRRKEGSYPADNGSYIADNLDIAMVGVVTLQLAPWTDDPSVDYPDVIDTTASGQDYVLAHRPFYPSEGNVIENICLALSKRYPVQCGSYWPNEWFNPDENGIVTPYFNRNFVGGHSYWIWGHIPGYTLCDNSWGEGYTPTCAQFGWGMRPGSFAIPDQVLTEPNSIFFEFRAASPEVVPAPVPPVSATCKSAAMGIINDVITMQENRLASRPRSVTYRNMLKGGQEVQQAVEMELPEG